MKKLLLIYFNLLFFSFFSFAQSSLEDGLVAYFPLDNDVQDYSPLHIDGENYNAVPVSDGVRSYYHFNGSDAYILAGNDDRSIEDVVGVSVWVRTTSPNLMWVVGHYDAFVDRGFHVYVKDGYALLGGRDGSDTYYSLIDDVLISDGEWHHIVAFFDENKWVLVVDQKIHDFFKTTTELPSYFVDSQPLSIGKFLQSENDADPLFFEGDIDEVRIYNRTLSMCEICELYSEQTEETTSVESNEAETQESRVLSVSPNPSEYYFQVNLLEQVSDKANLKLYAIDGRLILEKAFNHSTKINTSTLPQGTYFVSVTDGENNYTKKIIIQ